MGDSIVFINLFALWTGTIGWGIYGLITLVSISKYQTQIEYFGQLVSVGFMGLGTYIVLMSFAALIPTIDIATLGSALAILVSFGVMCRAHFRRLKVVGLKNWRAAVWIVSFGVAFFIVLSS